MKKVVLSLVVLFSVAMVACNGNKKAEAADTIDTIAAIEEVAVDTVNDSVAAAAATETVDAAGDTTVTVEAVEAGK